MREWILRKAVTIRCACGCGAELLSLDNKGRPHRFLPGHQSRVSNPGLAKIAQMPKPKTGEQWRANGEHRRTARARARSLTDHSVCTWGYIGGCKGPIQVAHVDGNFTNNAASNRVALCVSHHRLLDNRRIDPLNPVMPSFHTGTNGKRRYDY